MTYKTAYWDTDTQSQQERDCTPEEIAEIEARIPSQSSVLASLKTAKNDEINLARARANQSYFTYAGKQIACDALSRSDIDAANGSITLNGVMPPGWPGAWKAVDNSHVSIPDVETWKAFYAAMVQQGMVNFAQAQALKAALAAATTAEQISAVVWA